MMLKQVANKAAIVPTTIRQFSTTSIALAGRQGGPQRRKAEKKFDVDFMPKFDFDDQTTIGHSLFENIREVRQYLRKTEFELPKLNAFAKPFEAPKADQILRIKSHTYVGEGHPVEKKVVLNVKVSDLKLNDTEKHKLLLLSGSRYNVNTDELVMSSEKFPHRKQNKKYLLDVLKKLIAEAKDTKDTFADIPLNLAKPKQRLEFPKEWIRAPVEDTVTEDVEKSAQVLEELVNAAAKNKIAVDEKTL